MRILGSRTFEKSGEGSTAAPLRTSARRVRIGLALGAGSARGWAHIGVLRELEAQGVRADVIAGSSIGAIVGGCYAADKLDDIESFARGLTKRRMFSLVDLTFSGAGLIAGARLRSRLESALGDTRIEDLPRKFAAVATAMGSGHEIWLTRGPLVEAMRASYALPGIFEPVRVNGRWLFDGALVNPIPVTVCRAFGADIVLAINLNADPRRPAHAFEEVIEPQAIAEAEPAADEAAERNGASRFLPSLRGRGGLFRKQFSVGGAAAPGIATGMVDAFNITQDRIARSRLAGDPPDLQISPRIGRVGFFDFHRADELIALGREATQKAMPDIRETIAQVTAE